MIETLLSNLDTLLLLACAAGALGCAALMLVLRQPMRVAMALIAAMILLGGIYGLLGVHFVAAFQVLIYVGAVMVFMVYVIMLLEVREDSGPRYSRLLVPGGLGLVVLLVALVAGIWRPLPSPTREIGESGYGIASFSVAFLDEYWLLFELTSVLLVAGVVAALAVIRVGRARPGRESARG
jgi:NADH-quinone oxidoreductase subunit J